MSFSVSKHSIGDLFSGDNLFALPAYQRPFSWTSEEAVRLLEDLSVAYADEDDGEYFLGMTVCVKQQLEVGQSQSGLPNLSSTSDRSINVLGIIDGQQRFGTLTILLAVLRDLSEQKSERRFLRDMLELSGAVHPYRLVLFTNDTEIFEHFVQPDGSTTEQTDNPDLHASQERILEIRDIFTKRLSQMAPLHRSGLIKFIAEKVILILVSTEELDEGYKIFLGLNDTGRILEIADIGRAIFLGSVPPETREETTRSWRRNEDMLGEEFDSIFSFIQRIHGRRNKKVISENVAISKLAGGSAPYIKNVLTPLAESLIYLKDPKVRNLPDDHDIHRHITMLRWIKNDAWLPPALQFLSSHKHGTDEVDEFFRELHRLVFGLTILGLGESKRLTRHRALTRDIMNSNLWNKSTSKLFLSLNEQKNALYQLTFNLYSSSTQSPKLILLYLNDMFAGGDLAHHPGKITVEHVFPRRPTKKSEWLKILADANQRDECRSSLGNLVPLELELNIRINNRDYADKIDMIFERDRVTGVRKPTPFAITNRLLGIAKWDHDTIMANEAIYLDMLKKSLRLEGPYGMELRAPKKKAKKTI